MSINCITKALYAIEVQQDSAERKDNKRQSIRKMSRTAQNTPRNRIIAQKIIRRYTVNRILRHIIKRNNTHYFIRWSRYGKDDYPVEPPHYIPYHFINNYWGWQRPSQKMNTRIYQTAHKNITQASKMQPSHQLWKFTCLANIQTNRE